MSVDLHVFAYGSLMWKPGFAYTAVQPARLHGYHRSLCIYSFEHRGTPQRPGLVLGLDRGGSCRGLVYRVAAAESAAVQTYLDARELTTDVYLRRWLPVYTDAGAVTALCYVARRDHVQYAGKLAELELLRLVRQGVGGMGPCVDYVVSTVAHLDEMGVHDHGLRALAARLRAVEA